MSTITNENTQGLGHFHSNNLLHMDIKPDNIFRRSTANSVMYKLGEFHLTTYCKTGYSVTINIAFQTWNILSYLLHTLKNHIPDLISQVF